MNKISDLNLKFSSDYFKCYFIGYNFYQILKWFGKVLKSKVTVINKHLKIFEIINKLQKKHFQ